jgi:hypothetical protein
MMVLRSRSRSQLVHDMNTVMQKVVHTIRDSQGATPAFHCQQYTKVKSMDREAEQDHRGETDTLNFG